MKSQYVLHFLLYISYNVDFIFFFDFFFSNHKKMNIRKDFQSNNIHICTKLTLKKVNKDNTKSSDLR